MKTKYFEIDEGVLIVFLYVLVVILLVIKAG